MANPIFEGFSVSHVAILDGATSAEDIAATIGSDIYGVRSASLDPDAGSFDNEGDDAILSTWAWLNFVTLNVTSGYISFTTLAAITGAAISSSGAGATQKFSMDLWHEDHFNPSPKPAIIRVPSKDSAGVVRRIDFVIYKLQFGPMTFAGPAYKTGMEVTYSGRALMSGAQETGVVFADGKKRIGRVVSGASI